jgi:hypothetical protein
MEKVGENHQVLGNDKSISQEEKESSVVNGEKEKAEAKNNLTSSEPRKE